MSMVSIMSSSDVLFPVLFTAVAVMSVTGSSEVKERTVPYSCCGCPELKFNQSCENTWRVKGKTIAHRDDTTSDCISPCLKIGDELMTLNQCVDVNVIIKCIDRRKVTVEERIHYQGQNCSATVSGRMAPQNPGCLWLLLLAVVIAGWM